MLVVVVLMDVRIVLDVRRRRFTWLEEGSDEM
jgi:hypothetical protein